VLVLLRTVWLVVAGGIRLAPRPAILRDLRSILGWTAEGGRPMLRRTLLRILDGSQFANAMMNWGSRGPIRLPDDPSELLHLHLSGAPAEVSFAPMHGTQQRKHVESLSLAAFCPAADGLARWVSVDLDGPSHGDAGLADPAHAARVIISAADGAGLADGLLIAKSRSGAGRHLFLLLPGPVPLDNAAIGLAGLVARAYRLAAADVAEYGALHAFRRVDGAIAEPGESVELIPRSTVKPARGWSLVLPVASQLIEAVEKVPVADAWHWARLVAESKRGFPRQTLTTPRTSSTGRRKYAHSNSTPLERIDARTRLFLSGQVQPGGRNRACFSAAANLLGCGVDAREAEELVLAGASSCGLPAHEARAAFASAVGVLQRKGRR